MRNIKTFEDFILEQTFSDDFINESVMDNIKSYARKGVLTAVLLASLLGNSTYSQTQKDSIVDSLKTEIVQPGPMEQFLNKFAGPEYFIAKGSCTYNIEVAKDLALIQGRGKGSIVAEKAFKKDGTITYIIIYKK